MDYQYDDFKPIKLSELNKVIDIPRVLQNLD